ncbi:SgcJ/EcaC family oxidoreductase [Curvibacter sp. HBC28]|uniref:SgcJ/EcaC family oxidoreductase n=1 Tax=Curvibacter microcysteis TaxID=3026419 RepID=A0ABT5M9D8_9BURK|nr:SgcJ/EcaC family oxidoreductase [Curvibacter sp. HBC28]MDD0813193.1 SgcJ/EcaC family oxidoreductase [Curvibacter sp. HBC28]
MLNIRQTLAAFTLSALIVPGLSLAAASPTEQAILQTLAQYEAALNASDTSRIVSLYTPEGVQMAPDAPAAVGAAAVRSTYDATFKAITLQLNFKVDEVKLLSENTALLRTHSAGTMKVNSAHQAAGPAAFKELFLLQKQADGQWKFSHYSFSAAPVTP